MKKPLKCVRIADRWEVSDGTELLAIVRQKGTQYVLQYTGRQKYTPDPFPTFQKAIKAISQHFGREVK